MRVGCGLFCVQFIIIHTSQNFMSAEDQKMDVELKVCWHFNKSEMSDILSFKAFVFLQKEVSRTEWYIFTPNAKAILTPKHHTKKEGKDE